MSQQQGNVFPRSRNRAAVVLLDGSNVCLIERNRKGRIYYLFPGGGVDAGETHEQAAVREAQEELGVTVKLLQLIADLKFKGARQTYHLARIVGGKFGTGTGEEMANSAASKSGSYTPLWMPLRAALQRDTRPKVLIKALLDESYRQKVLRRERS